MCTALWISWNFLGLKLESRLPPRPKGREFPSSVRDYIPHLRGSREGQRTTPILKVGHFSSLNSGPLKEGEMTVAPPAVPLSPQSSWGGASLASLKGILKKEKFELSIRGLSIPALKGEAFRPLNLFLCKDLVILINTICTFKLLSFPETILIRLNLTSQIVNRHSSLKAHTLPLHSLLSLR